MQSKRKNIKIEVSRSVEYPFDNEKCTIVGTDSIHQKGSLLILFKDKYDHTISLHMDNKKALKFARHIIDTVNELI